MKVGFFTTKKTSLPGLGQIEHACNLLKLVHILFCGHNEYHYLLSEIVWASATPLGSSLRGVSNNLSNQISFKSMKFGT